MHMHQIPLSNLLAKGCQLLLLGIQVAFQQKVNFWLHTYKSEKELINVNQTSSRILITTEVNSNHSIMGH